MFARARSSRGHALHRKRPQRQQTSTQPVCWPGPPFTAGRRRHAAVSLVSHGYERYWCALLRAACTCMPARGRRLDGGRSLARRPPVHMPLHAHATETRLAHPAHNHTSLCHCYGAMLRRPAHSRRRPRQGLARFGVARAATVLKHAHEPARHAPEPAPLAGRPSGRLVAASRSQSFLAGGRAARGPPAVEFSHSVSWGLAYSAVAARPFTPAPPPPRLSSG